MLSPFSQPNSRPWIFGPQRRWPILCFFGLFAASILFAYVWFNTNIGHSSFNLQSSNSEPRIWLTARTNIPGYLFIEEPATDKVKRALDTTNILSGAFVPLNGAFNSVNLAKTQTSLSPRLDSTNSSVAVQSGEWEAERAKKSPSSISELPPLGNDCFRVFFASWPPTTVRDLRVAPHTPDACWVNAGWERIDLGQSRQVVIILPLGSTVSPSSSETTVLDAEVSVTNNQVRPAPNSFPKTALLPFECRVFKAEQGKSIELALWGTFANGEIISEPTGLLSLPANGGLPARLFGRAISNPHPIPGLKQFVRFSMPVTSDLATALGTIKRFASCWLEADRKQMALE